MDKTSERLAINCADQSVGQVGRLEEATSYLKALHSEAIALFILPAGGISVAWLTVQGRPPFA